MKKVKNAKVSEKENAIDTRVENQALDDAAWGTGVEVTPRLKPTSIRLSSRTIQRAKIFARIHRQRGYQSWLKKIIEERINNEYEVYKGLRDHPAKRS
jgi:predicted DNA binding CopG/RHH family protein